MNELKKNILENRVVIADNLDAIIKYGQKSQKSKSVGQLSLFDSLDDEVQIEPIRLKERQLSDYELGEAAKKERELIGVPLTYDPFTEYFLIERTLCTSTLKEIIFAEDNTNTETFLCEITKTEKRTSKAGNGYYKVYMTRDGDETYAYLFGDNIANNLRKINPGKIHIVRTISSGNMLTVKKIEQCDNVNISNYVAKVLVELPDKMVNLDKIRNYIYFSMKKDEGVNLYFKYGGEVLDNPVFKVSVSNENCEELMELGCKIFAKKI